MTDLVFDDDWRKWEFWHKGQQIEQSARLAAGAEIAWLNYGLGSEGPIRKVGQHHSRHSHSREVQEVTQPYSDRYNRYTRPAAAGIMQWPNPPHSALTLRQ
jgi:hypothetical protein